MAEPRSHMTRRPAPAEPAAAASGLFPSDSSTGGILRSIPAASAPDDGGVSSSLTAAPAPSAEKPLSVTELTRELKALLQSHFPTLYVEGEISGCKAAASGHVYFTLKDEKAAISCVLWGTLAGRLKKPLRDGDKVEIRGSLDIFPARGSYQIIVQSVRPAGLGRLFAAFQEMKERLEQEGLFDKARKRPIPSHPRVVGVVTSPTGAVIRDILHVLGRRAPHIAVLLYPTRVQGEGSAPEIAHAIRRFNAIPGAEEAEDGGRKAEGGEKTELRGAVPRPDVLIVGRGGGSMEDLWSFNEEVVARAIFESDIPVISAVGHETDFTIADFVADLRAPTPSAAAEVVARDSGELLRDLAQTTQRLKGALKQRIGFLREAPHLKARLEGAFLPRVKAMRDTLTAFRRSHALQRPLQRVNEERQRLDDFHQSLIRALEKGAREATLRHGRIAAQLSALNPRAVLSRGYSITMNAESGKAIRHPEEVNAGTRLRIILHAGQLDAVAGTGEGLPEAPAGRKATARPDLAAAGAGPAKSKGKRTRTPKPDPAATPDLFAETAT